MVDNLTEKNLLNEKLRELSVQSDIEIGPATEIFYDLKISGDDFDELIGWISEEFETDFSNMNGKYVPGEAEIFPLIFRIFGRRPYKSITVQDFLNAVARKRW